MRSVADAGPPAMASAVLRALRALRVLRRQVHAERFSLVSRISPTGWPG